MAPLSHRRKNPELSLHFAYHKLTHDLCGAYMGRCSPRPVIGLLRMVMGFPEA